VRNNERYLAFLQPFLKRFSRCPICGANFYFFTFSSKISTARTLAMIAALALVGVAAAAPTSWDGKSALPANTGGGKNWVLLVAGSNTYDNYRHQSGPMLAFRLSSSSL
jgi:hypothetical protein